MFERFTHQAREAVIRTQEIARERDDPSIAAVHLLAALATEGSGIDDLLGPAGVTPASLFAALNQVPPGEPLDADALARLGIDLDAVRSRVEAHFGEGALDADPPRTRRRRSGLRDRLGGNHLPFTDDAKRALELSLREVLRLGGRAIGGEAMLLGVLGCGDREVLAALDLLGVDLAPLVQAAEARIRRAA